MTSVFLSYSRHDEAAARRIAEALGRHGYDVWWDRHLPAHRAYSDVIEQKLREAKAVVVLWSAQAVQSEWVRSEADFARKERKLVQAQLDAAPLPLPFDQIQCPSLKGWRGGDSHEGWHNVIASVASLAEREPPERPALAPRPVWRRLPVMAGLAILLLIAAAAALLVPRFFGSGGEEPPVVAVMPFRSLAAEDANLAAGLWEDTRQALSRNPQLRVLGPHSSETLAQRDADPKLVRELGVDHLLTASLRRAGNRIRMTATLVRTDDNTQLWSDTFDRGVEDVFALQAELAREVEGRVRGRLAQGGGKRAESIVTSAAAYALFNDARANLRERGEGSGQALEQLREVLRMDPNFAPAWASLAVAETLKMWWFEAAEERNPEAHARRAITLAPNLATGHAALALAHDLRGPVAEASLRRAVALDPSDAQSLHWLAILVRAKDPDQALELLDQAIRIDPLWWPAVLHRARLLAELGRDEAVGEELARLRRAGASALASTVQISIYADRNDLSEAARAAIRSYKAKETGPASPSETLAGLLIQLGYLDAAEKIIRVPPFVPLVWRNDVRALDSIEERDLPPAAYWANVPPPLAFSRLYVLAGRGDELADLYRKGAGSPERLRRVLGGDAFVSVAPIVALAIAGEGDTRGRDALLAEARAVLGEASPQGRTAPARKMALARIRAVEGSRAEALRLLAEAVRDGYLPDMFGVPTDLAFDPALATLHGAPEFERARASILGVIARERAELGPVQI